MVMKGYSTFQDGSLTIRLFSIIYRTVFVGRVLPSVEMQSLYFTAAADWVTQNNIAQSAEAVVYTNCDFTEAYPPHQRVSKILH